MIVHRLAWIALICLIILIVAGAIVRVTGSGLGCPDWPTCWGRLIPPTSADQIDIEKLDISKFKRQAERRGIDPDSITRETVLESFDPVHTWIEFINRLVSLPLGFAVLILAIVSLKTKRHRTLVAVLSWLALINVLFNAILGAMVVRSGLQPGIITLHMALAFLLISILITIIWLSRPEPAPISIPQTSWKRLLIVSLIFFACLFAEGLMGSQLREQTDELGKLVEGLSRQEWVGELEKTWIYKAHRSFSWTLLLTSGLMFFWTQKLKEPRLREPKFILCLIIAMMIMGIVLGHISIFAVVQVLHVGTTSVLLALTWHWILRLFRVGIDLKTQPNADTIVD